MKHIEDLALSPDPRFRDSPEWILQMHQKYENSVIDGWKPTFTKHSNIAKLGEKITSKKTYANGRTVSKIDKDHECTLAGTERGSTRYWAKKRRENLIRNRHWSKNRPDATTYFCTRTMNPKWFEIQHFLGVFDQSETTRNISTP